MSESRTQPCVESSTLARNRNQWAPKAAAIIIILAGVAAYHNSLQGEFMFDDNGSIEDNPTIRSLWPIWKVLSPPGDWQAIQNRPVVNLSLAINYAIGELDVRGYHVFNLIVHILAALTLFGIIRRTLHLSAMPGHISGAATPLALAAALIWTVHPLTTEAVAYIIQRTESLMGLFYLLTLYCMIRGAGVARPFWWYVTAVVACALGMGCKEVMVTAPLIVLLYDRLFLARSFKDLFHRRWPLYIGLAATWVLLAALVIPTGGRGDTAGLGYWVVVRYYALAQCIAITRYLGLCFWPHPLIVDYGFCPTSTLAQAGPYAILIALLLVATVRSLRDRPCQGFLGVWFFAILAPSSSVVPLLAQAAAEKRMYLPLAAVVTGVVIFVYGLGRRLLVRLHPAVGLRKIVGGLLAVALTGAVVVILGFLTVRRNYDYRSNSTIWHDTVDKLPTNCRAWVNRGAVYLLDGKLDQAISDFTKAIELKDEYAEAYFNRGSTYRMKGDYNTMKSDYNKALGDLTKAIELKHEFAGAYNERALVYFHKRKYKSAWADINAAKALGYKVNPEFLEALRKASARN